MFKKPTLFSFSGSFVFHLAFVVFAGNYFLNSPPPPPKKKVYRLEIIKKKPPVEKKKIQERKRLKRKTPKLLRQKKQPRVAVRQKPLMMAKVKPFSTPRPMKRQFARNNLISPVSSLSSVPITAKAVKTEPRRLDQLTTPKSVVSSRVSAFEAKPSASVSFTAPEAVRSSLILNNTAVNRRVSSWVSKSAQQIDLPQKVHLTSKSFSSKNSKGTRAAYFEGLGQKVSIASINPRAIPNFTDEGALRGYRNSLGKTIARNKKYPKLSRVNQEEGIVIIKFFILRSGKIRNLVWVKKSPYERLNREAFDAVNRSAPFAELPSEIPGRYLEIELPFRFRLN